MWFAMGMAKKYRMGRGTCRCPMCGKKDSDSNNVRRGYTECRIGRDEHGRDWNGLSKKQTRKLRRLREKRNWKGMR